MKAIAIFFALLLSAAMSLARAGGQIYPAAPAWPTNSLECDAYARQVSQLKAQYSEQHQACLDAHSKEPARSEPNMGICSQRACQSLHDIVYGDVGKWADGQLSACRDAVHQYMAAQQRQIDQFKAQQQAVDTQRQLNDSLASQRLSAAASLNAQADSYRRDTERLQSSGSQVNLQAMDKLYKGRSLEPRASGQVPELPEKVSSVDPLLEDARRTLNEVALDKIQDGVAKGIGEWVDEMYGIPSKITERAIGTAAGVASTAQDAKELWHQLTSDSTSEQAEGAAGAVALVAEHSFTNPFQGKFVALETNYVGHVYSNAMKTLDAAFAISEGQTPDAQGQAMIDDPTLILPGVQSLRDFNTKLEMVVAKFRSLLSLSN